jgi:hypothetical protein
MNACSRPALWCSVVLVTGLSQCVTEPPYLSPGAGTGISLDSGPYYGRRSRQETRYLENAQPTQPPPFPSAGPSISPPVYETPQDIDPSLSTEAPMKPDQSPVTTAPGPETAQAPAASTTTPPPPPPPATTSPPEQMPFGLPVPGKKGFVYSPFDKSQMVDVRGIPPGKKVRCPYTSKIFLVP